MSEIDYETPRKAREWDLLTQDWKEILIVGKCPHNILAPNRDNCALCGASGHEVYQETGKTFRKLIQESKAKGNE